MIEETLLVTGGLVGDRPLDLRMAGDLISAVGPRLRRERRDTVIDVAGAHLLPGLHDHHVHLRAWAAARTSVPTGPPEVTDAAGMAAALRTAPAGPQGWVRAVGYHESVAGELDRAALDRLITNRPVRLQHRSGALWVLNSAALAAVGLDDGPDRSGPEGVERDGAGRPTGRLWRADGWLGRRVPRPDDGDGLLADISRIAARRGVTGFTDATPERDASELVALARATRRGVIGQRLHLMSPPEAQLPAEVDAKVTLGPVKVLLDDDRLPSVDALAATVTEGHRSERPVAVHCVTRVQAVLTIAAFEVAGTVAGDRMEHGAVLAASQLPQVAALGLTVVTQPGFIDTRGDRYLVDVEAFDRPDLWRVRSLLDAGIAVAAGTDAPLGPADPWESISTAVTRRTSTGAIVGPEERATATSALRLWSGYADRPAVPRHLAVGQPADLCAVIRQSGRGWPDGVDVVLTVVAGTVVHHEPPG